MEGYVRSWYRHPTLLTNREFFLYHGRQLASASVVTVIVVIVTVSQLRIARLESGVVLSLFSLFSPRVAVLVTTVATVAIVAIVVSAASLVLASTTRNVPQTARMSPAGDVTSPCLQVTLAPVGRSPVNVAANVAAIVAHGVDLLQVWIPVLIPQSPSHGYKAWYLMATNFFFLFHYDLAASAPPTRKKLELQPRSADASAAAAPAEAKGSKANPFGDAKPVNNDDVIRRVEEKLNQEQQEKKEAAEKARKEKEGREKKDGSGKKEHADGKKEHADGKREAQVEA